MCGVEVQELVLVMLLLCCVWCRAVVGDAEFVLVELLLRYRAGFGGAVAAV